VPGEREAGRRDVGVVGRPREVDAFVQQLELEDLGPRVQNLLDRNALPGQTAPARVTDVG
jgi:hypothetical protein